MPSIHLVERADAIRRRGADKSHFESGNWVIAPERAQSLVGGHIYFHRGQKDRSHFGGTVTGFRVLAAPHPNTGRVVLEFTSEKTCLDVSAPEPGWGNEQNFVK